MHSERREFWKSIDESIGSLPDDLKAEASRRLSILSDIVRQYTRLPRDDAMMIVNEYAELQMFYGETVLPANARDALKRYSAEIVSGAISDDAKELISYLGGSRTSHAGAVPPVLR